MTGRNHSQWQADQPFHTAVLYFAAGHFSGPQTVQWTNTLNLQSFRHLRRGSAPEAHQSQSYRSLELWKAVKVKLRELDGKPDVPWHLWLENGVIRTHLSRYDELDKHADPQRTARLHALNGQTPMQLVLQRAQRDELLHTITRDGWRVQPELSQAVRDAIDQYNAARAPLYPLSPIKRLGYCDEHDWLLCTRDLGPFRAGHRYPLRTQTVLVTRTKERPSVTGEPETIRFSGHELAILLTDSPWNPDTEPDYSKCRERLFMDPRIKADPNTDFEDIRRGNVLDAPPVDYTLHDLVEHFEIPDVPDVASVNPDGYSEALRQLDAIEKAIASLQ